MSKIPPHVSHARAKCMLANKLAPLREYSKVYKPLQERTEALQSLKKTLQKYEPQILEALQKDLHKHPSESFLSELLQVYKELEFMLKHLPKLMRPKKVKTPLTHFGSQSRIYPQSYGLVLIISPWNYPLNLSLIPLIGAIAGGNCVLLKPSEYSTHTSALLVRIISESLPKLAQVVLGDSKVSESLLEEQFDLVFFTGSVPVGRIVMQKAAAHLTPVVLELGGKNPCIITKSADIMSAAKKVAWGKFLNAGQTCIAPDYLLVQECVLEEFVEALKKWIREFFGENPKQSENFGRIISARHFARIESLMYRSLEYMDSLPTSARNVPKTDSIKLVLGGELDAKSLYVAPTIFILPRDRTHPLMQEEIFAPIVPIMPFRELSECLVFSAQFPKPLASYIFTRDSTEREFFLQNFSFGNGCVNDCVMQVANPHLPFGGIGSSGMGSYHGVQSFRTFTHQKSVLENHFEIALRYPPFRDKLFGIDFKKICKFVMRF